MRILSTTFILFVGGLSVASFLTSETLAAPSTQTVVPGLKQVQVGQEFARFD